MKTALKVILIICIILIGAGSYLNLDSSGSGEKFVGIGALIFAFILMPLFIYHRYKNKDLSNYAFKDRWWEGNKKDD